ncbi:MAG: hypothetical protein ABI599_04195 [Flavobacteriales bacterium]
MKTKHVALGAALLFAVGASAQNSTASSTGTAPATSVTHHCLDQADDAAWTSLGLKPEQVTRVKAIQADHKKACANMTAEDKAKKEAEMASMTDTDLKAVLTPEQYTNWQKWCSTKDGSKAMQKAEPTKTEPKM